jgi:hypothetical protein
MTTIAAPRTVEGMNMKSDREVVEGALALIEVDRGWTQGTYCRDADGYEVLPAVDAPGEWVRLRTEHVGDGGYRAFTDAGAKPCSFCVQGALRASAGCWRFGLPNAAQEQQIDRLEALLLELANSAAVPGWMSLAALNDAARTTQADIVLVLKRAAAHLEALAHEHP